jgi:hypothetical protein
MGVNTAERVPMTTPAAPAARRLPGLQALTVGKARVQHGDRRAKTGLEARNRLRREADFRHQHQGLLPTSQAVSDKLQIDLGFAAASNPLQQVTGKVLPGNSIEHLDLLRAQGRAFLA